MDLIVLTRAYFSYVWDIPILVTPICIVRRSRSLPDDTESTNQAPDLIDLADINDLTSSKSGASGNSNDKPDQDNADEEADQFVDASPLTPVHSPGKRPATAGSPESSRSRSKKSSPNETSPSETAAVVPDRNATRDLLLFADGVVPVVNVTILREAASAEPRTSCVEKNESKISPSCDSRADFSGRKSSQTEREEPEKDFAVYDTGPSTSTSHGYRQERRKSVKRQGSLVKEKPIESESAVGADEVVGLVDNSSFESALTSAKGNEDEDDKAENIAKEFADEATKKLAKDRRKSLKEQESIERVNEYLAKHGQESAAQTNDKKSSDARRKSLKETRPPKFERTAERRPSLALDLGLGETSSEKRRKSLTKQDNVEIVADHNVENGEESAGPASFGRETPEDSEPGKRGDPPLEVSGKKEVKIRENVEKIFYEDNEEQVTTIPEVKLVRARIISSEEAALGLAVKVQLNKKVDVNSPPEIVNVEDDDDKNLARSKNAVAKKFRKAALSEEDEDGSFLGLPLLTKSTSENVLTETDEEVANNISVKNFRPDVLLDLSKLPNHADEVGERSRDGVDSSPKEKRVLSRVGSEGSKKVHELKLSSRISPVPNSRVCSSTRNNAETIDSRSKFFDDTAATSVRSDEETIASDESREDFNRTVESKEAAVTETLTKSVSAIREQVVEEERDGSKEAGSAPQSKPEVVTKTLYKSDFPVNRADFGYKNVDQRLREREFNGCSYSTRQESAPSVPKLRQPSVESSGVDPASNAGLQQRVQQILTTDKEAEEQRQKALEKQREHEKFLLNQRRVEEGETSIGKQHSLEYQSQTLGARLDEPLKLDRRASIGGEESRPEPNPERREAETQTQQETKSTQCGTDEPPEDAAPGSAGTGTPERFESPRKEAHTQTQGETKGTQCGPDDLAETFSQLKTFFKQKHSGNSSGPVEAEAQTEQESKSTQFSLEDHLEVRGASGTSVPRPEEFPTGVEPARSASSLYSSSPIIVLVDGRTDMTVTHSYKDKDGNVVWAKHWGPERLVEIYREPKSSLGLSIVGGKVDLYHGGPNTSQNISGIFIKNVLPDSPAGRTGDLKTGDRIIEVDGIDLRNSTHDRAVKAIQAAGNPVCLLVQSLVHLSTDDDRERTSSRDTDDNSATSGSRGVRRQGTRGHGAIVGASPSTPTTSFRRKPPAVSPARTITPELIQEGIEDEARQGGGRSDHRRQSTKNDSDGAGPSVRRSSVKRSLRKKAPSPPKGAGILREVSEEGEEQPQTIRTKPKYSSDESSDEEDTRDLEGNVYTKAGIEISRKSAGNVKRTREEIEADNEEEDEFGYTSKKIKKRYDALGHPVVMVRLEKDRRGLGISLAGHKDRNRMAVFVCGLNPKGVAHKTGGLNIGDEILEVNGTVLQGRCHLNASAMIKGMPGPCFKVIVLRRSSAVNDLAVKPIVQFPPTLDEDDPDRFNHYKGVRTVSIKKGQYGLGIMIIEGKHAEVGQGIFVSDIQEGSAAEQAGLQVGDMILAVNLDCLLGSSYDEATSLLKKTEGVVTLTVCNPNQSKLAKEEEERAKGGDPAAASGVDASKAIEAEKPKEPEPPKDPKDCEISEGRETTIEFPKDKEKAVGIVTAGGAGTPLGGIVILEIFPEGAAGKDGRLKPGDQILEICHESFKAIEHAKAHEAILKASGPINMVVYRDNKPAEEFDVEIPKKSGKGVGLCLTGFKSGKGAYVSDMLPGGSALESGKITKGDRVVAVGGQDVRESPVEDIALHVKVSNPVQLKLARYKAAKQ